MGSIMRSNVLAAIASAGLLFSGIGACTGNLGSTIDKDGKDVTDDTIGNGGSGADDLGNLNSGGSGAGNGEENNCANLTLEPQAIPVSMFITVDKSGSMDSNNKWNNAKSAFINFFTSAEADDLNVALRFWPDGGCDTSCNVGACAQPQVPMGSLGDNAHESALISAFNSKSPNGLTPMESALAGAEQYALDWQAQAEAGGRIVVILLTDGVPTACNENIGVISSYAADAYQQAEILTFAVGLQGSNESQMNTIAQAGNTSQGYFIGNGNTQQDLLNALLDIQQVAVSCSFAMPESPDPNSPIDPQQVNIDLEAGGTTDTVPQVGGAGDCGPEGGWYYDDPLDPAIIELCPATCDLANDSPDNGIQVTVGCATIVQ
jgi:von Willebrand factor type A domain